MTVSFPGIIAAGLGALSVFLFAIAARRTKLVELVARYLEPPLETQNAAQPRRDWPTGLLAWAGVGALVGVLLAQGDLFVSGSGRPVFVVGLLGAAGGAVVRSMRDSSGREREIEHMRYELPTIADSLALQILTGESIPSALRAVVRATNGVVPRRLDRVVDESEDIGMESALLSAAARADHPDERRLFDTLAHAHAFGGRVGDSLATLAADYRASLEREVAEQSGRKAVTAYGPILALMVPTALAFLLYPTLVGLRSLGGAP